MATPQKTPNDKQITPSVSPRTLLGKGKVETLTKNITKNILANFAKNLLKTYPRKDLGSLGSERKPKIGKIEPIKNPFAAAANARLLALELEKELKTPTAITKVENNSVKPANLTNTANSTNPTNTPTPTNTTITGNSAMPGLIPIPGLTPTTGIFPPSEKDKAAHMRSMDPNKIGALPSNGNGKGHKFHNIKYPDNHPKGFIYVVTCVSAISGFLFGYDTGIISGAMVFIREAFSLSDVWQEVIVSGTILAAWLFSLFAGRMSNNIGRKSVIISGSVVFTVGGFIMAGSPTKEVLLIGRFVVGAAIGLTSMVIPIYIAEVAPYTIRGRLVTFNACCIPLGQFIASLIAGLFSSDTETGWRWMLGLAVIPSMVQLFLFFSMPASPRWLILKGRYEEALNALAICRSAQPKLPQVQAEFEMIKENVLIHQCDSNKGLLEIINNPPIAKALFIGSTMMMYQQLAGINTVMYYSATIIQMSGVQDKSTAVWLSAIASFLNTLGSFISFFLVEKCGRRKLYLSSMFFVILSLIFLGISFMLDNQNTPIITFQGDHGSPSCLLQTSCATCVKTPDCAFCFYDIAKVTSMTGRLFVNGSCVGISLNDSNIASSSSSVCGESDRDHWVLAHDWCPSNYTWLILLGLCAYLLAFAPGMGTMSWTITSEIYPLRVRSICSGISTSANWFFNLAVSLTFLTLTDALSAHGAYFLYAGITLSGFILFYKILPETRGRSLEDIDNIFLNPLCMLPHIKLHSSGPEPDNKPSPDVGKPAAIEPTVGASTALTGVSRNNSSGTVTNFMAIGSDDFKPFETKAPNSNNFPATSPDGNMQMKALTPLPTQFQVNPTKQNFKKT